MKIHPLYELQRRSDVWSTYTIHSHSYGNRITTKTLHCIYSQCFSSHFFYSRCSAFYSIRTSVSRLYLRGSLYLTCIPCDAYITGIVLIAAGNKLMKAKITNLRISAFISFLRFFFSSLQSFHFAMLCMFLVVTYSGFRPRSISTSTLEMLNNKSDKSYFTHIRHPRSMRYGKKRYYRHNGNFLSPCPIWSCWSLKGFFFCVCAPNCLSCVCTHTVPVILHMADMIEAAF